MPMWFVRPLGIFLPREREVGAIGRGKDWSLTLVCIGDAFMSLLGGSYQVKMQYAMASFGWDSTKLGFWLSLIGFLRAFHLLVVLPLCIKIFKPKPESSPIKLPFESNEPDSPSPSTSTYPPPVPSSLPPTDFNTAHFDLIIAQISLCIDLILYIGVVLVSQEVGFVVVTVLVAFSGGFGPAVRSLSVGLMRGGNDAGKLFGGLSVLGSLCSQIIGPSLYGLTYVMTVSTFPKAIFVLSTALIASSMVALALVRLPGSVNLDEEREPMIQADAAVGVQDEPGLN